jgi:hypothetical protein
MHTNLLCACWHLEAMKGSSSLTSCRLLILSRLPSSFVWAQLTLLVPTLGIRPLFSQDDVPIHWVRAHSLTGIRNKYNINLTIYRPGRNNLKSNSSGEFFLKILYNKMRFGLYCSYPYEGVFQRTKEDYV